MDVNTCTHCGTELASDISDGLCPACALEAGLADVETDAGRADAPTTLQRIGGYELREEIARGGQGVVYRARHMELGREVALKLFPHGAWSSSAQLQRLRTEARVTADLDHPAIVPIYEIGTEGGQQFLAMKLIDGVSLNRLPPENQPAPRAAAEIIARAARAIHYAHERGVLHRDLKPGNILLDARGRPHITDFGLAKVVGGDSGLTLSTEMLGTPSYVSPEMATGDARAVGVAADVYGLGAVFYHLLCGQPPFAGSTPLDTIRQVVEVEPRSPRALNPAIDRDLELICLRCLEKDPARRYPSAAALADDLERALSGEPIDARSAGLVLRGRKWLRRHRTAAAAALTFAAGLGVAVVVVWPHASDPTTQLDRVEHMIDGLDTLPDDFQLAEDIMTGVLAQHPADARAVTLMARVQGMFPYRGIDRSDKRFATFRHYAERALQLAPDDPEALGAMALYHYTQRDDASRARHLIERAIAARPHDPDLQRLRVAILLNAPDVSVATAIAAAEDNAARFPDDALIHYQLAEFYRDDGRLVKMEEQLDRAIVTGPVPNALVWKAQVALWLRGDVAEMGSWLDRVPERVRTTERVVLARWAQAMAGGSYEDGFYALETLPQAWLESWSFTGPRHLLSGQLLALAGDNVRARLHFEQALAEVRQRQQSEPAEVGYRALEVWIQHGLGRDEEARALFHEYALPTIHRPYRFGPLNSWWFHAIACSLAIGDRETALALIDEATHPAPHTPGHDEPQFFDYEISYRATAAEQRAALRLRLRLDPRMVRWRDDPEIAALVAE